MNHAHKRVHVRDAQTRRQHLNRHETVKLSDDDGHGREEIRVREIDDDDDDDDGDEPSAVQHVHTHTHIPHVCSMYDYHALALAQMHVIGNPVTVCVKQRMSSVT